MHASTAVPPAAAISLSTSTCTPGVIVAALTKILPLRAGQQRIAAGRVDRTHRRIVGDDRDDDVARGGDAGQLFRRDRTDFGGQLARRARIDVVHGADRVPDVFEPARHIRAHAADADKSDRITHRDFAVSDRPSHGAPTLRRDRSRPRARPADASSRARPADSARHRRAVARARRRSAPPHRRTCRRRTRSPPHRTRRRVACFAARRSARIAVDHLVHADAGLLPFTATRPR